MAAFFSDTNSTEQLGKINVLCTIYIKLRLLCDWINTTQSFLKLIDQLLQNKLIWYISYGIVFQKEHNKHQCWKKTSIPPGILKFAALTKWLAKSNRRENANGNSKGDIFTFLEGFKIFMSSNIIAFVETLQCCLIPLQSPAPNQLRKKWYLKYHLKRFFFFNFSSSNSYYLPLLAIFLKLNLSKYFMSHLPCFILYQY